MEYIHGETVREQVRRLVRLGERLAWQTAVHWTSQVLDALEHAHGRKVIHRDIKPSNLMLTHDPTQAVKLLDMGLAKSTENASAGELSLQLTQRGQVLGTGDYMPPEQWAGGSKVVPESDLYGLGGTLFFMLTGWPPFLGEALGQLCMAHLHEAPPPLRQFRADVPEYLERILRQMLEKEPGARGTARELRLQLRRRHANIGPPCCRRGSGMGRGLAGGPAATRPRPTTCLKAWFKSG